MNGMGLSLSEICCLFCCPPCPSRIAAKLAFLPPEPTYSFEDEDGSHDKQKLVLSEKAEWQYSDTEKERLEVFYTRTAVETELRACMSNVHQMRASQSFIHMETPWILGK